jgi:phosphatidylglycerophosphate synthase
MTKEKIPPYSSLIKSRDVEDPVNQLVHRPLAYLFVRLIYRTPMTPDQVTYLALIVGTIAGLCWFIGTTRLMIVGGILLWSSAILDGADGILARAKGIQSETGRAVDGWADAQVAVVTVAAAFYHVLATDLRFYYPVLMLLAVGTTIAHVYLYDFYREAYMHNTDPKWDGFPESIADVQALHEKAEAERAFWIVRWAMSSFVRVKKIEIFLIGLTNPKAGQENLRFIVNEKTVDIYRRHNRAPMRLWMWVSTAPHSYLMAICGMFDRLDIYLWLRVVAANVIMIIALIWQHVATTRTRRDLDAIDAGPVPNTP